MAHESPDRRRASKMEFNEEGHILASDRLTLGDVLGELVRRLKLVSVRLECCPRGSDGQRLLSDPRAGSFASSLRTAWENVVMLAMIAEAALHEYPMPEQLAAVERNGVSIAVLPMPRNHQTLGSALHQLMRKPLGTTTEVSQATATLLDNIRDEIDLYRTEFADQIPLSKRVTVTATQDAAPALDTSPFAPQLRSLACALGTMVAAQGVIACRVDRIQNGVQRKERGTLSEIGHVQLAQSTAIVLDSWEKLLTSLRDAQRAAPAAFAFIRDNRLCEQGWDTKANGVLVDCAKLVKHAHDVPWGYVTSKQWGDLCAGLEHILDELRAIPSLPTSNDESAPDGQIGHPATGNLLNDKDATPPLIPLAIRKAGESLEWVRQNYPEIAPAEDSGTLYTKKDHEYICEYECPVYPKNKAGHATVPNYETWARYVREYFKLTRGRVNTKGGAPTTKSIVARKDI